MRNFLIGAVAVAAVVIALGIWTVDRRAEPQVTENMRLYARGVAMAR